MRTKKLVSLLLAVSLSFAVMGCGNTGDVQEEEKTNTNRTADQDMDMSGTDASSGGAVTYEGEAFYMKDGQVAGLQEEIIWDGCIWTVSSMELTKELGNRSQADVNYWGEAVDELGNLTGDESYLFVTVSCKNSSGSVQEVLLNSNGFVTVDEAGQLTEVGGEARYISKKQDGNNSPAKAFHYILEDGEETGWIEIGYILEDSDFDDGNKLYYCVGRQGSALGNPENRYVEVDRAQ